MSERSRKVPVVCPVCGAMVGPDLFDLHAKWHNKVANHG